MARFTERDLSRIFNEAGRELGLEIGRYKEDIEMGIGMAGEAYGLPVGGSLIECLQGFKSDEEAARVLTDIGDAIKRENETCRPDASDPSVDAAIVVLNKIARHFKP